jgi:hypothetical protein
VCEDLVVRAARHHVPCVLHMVPAERLPFGGVMPWQSEALVGATAPWRGGVELAPDRRPDYVVIDPELAGEAGLPACRRRTFTCAWEDLWHDAIRASVAAAAAAVAAAVGGGAGGAASVWLPEASDARLGRVAERLAAAGFRPTRERPAGGRAIAVAAGAETARWIGALAAGDVVVVAERSGRARGMVDAIRKVGGHAIAPPIGTIVASRVRELEVLAAALEARLGGSATVAAGDVAWVDPLLAPGTEQAVVDVELAAIVEKGASPWEALAVKVAEARARTLVAGTGRP